MVKSAANTKGKVTSQFVVSAEEEEEEENDAVVEIVENDEEEAAAVVDEESSKKKKKKKRLDLEAMAAEDAADGGFLEQLRKRGIIYISRVPPQMTPSKIKTLLGTHGEITRIYLEEEDKSVRKRRKKSGGSSSKRYNEGWIEFADKRLAKRIALSLNTTKITNKKKSYHADDIWNLKVSCGYMYVESRRKRRELNFFASISKSRRKRREDERGLLLLFITFCRVIHSLLLPLYYLSSNTL
jgi:ESF2/ABP1 family protein